MKENEKMKKKKKRKTEVKQNNSDKIQNEAIYTILIPLNLLAEAVND